jgi:hypothetical protein
MNRRRLADLLRQSLEHERCGVLVYQMALECVVNRDLRLEWQEHLEQTRTHVQILTDLCREFAIDPDASTPGSDVIQLLGAALAEAIHRAQKNGDADAAELVACECVVLAETKDHLDWELLAMCAGKLRGSEAKSLKSAHDEVADEEDEHLYHTKGWCRELWIRALGMRALLPPPEEQKHVKTAIGAARAQQAAHRAH